ncbi:MAG: DNA polymerase III subunit gamma/tau, partial [Ureaplasma sp.]|nr:DNA polymerase III subunit gamma/tau [Ureaplasma sp.]
MEQTTLYRKYRPNCFANVVGQKPIIKTLQNSISSDSFFHSYIFFGNHGCGKTSIARIFAKALNCIQPIDNDCCNKCENCLNSNNSLDIIEIDAASNSGVDEIRKIIENVDYLPIKLKKKIYIIDEAHMLSNSAWNALLKTIEEPPEHVIFIFATTEINKIPMTIMSRCQRFDFVRLDSSEINNLLDYVCQQEGILISNDAKYKINILSNGSARDCLSILQQISDYTNKSITIEAINEIFGFLNLDEKIDFINLFKTNPTSIISKLSSLKTNYLNFASDLIEIIMDKLVYLYTNDANLLKVLTISNIYKIDLDESM